MYQAPDFVKVSTKAEDVFAGYENSCMRLADSYYILNTDGGKRICNDEFVSGQTWVEQYPTAQWQCYYAVTST